MENRFKILNLKIKNEKISNREIGRLIHLSHNTVKKVILNEKVPKYQRQSTVIREIEAFKSIIEKEYLVKHLTKSMNFIIPN